MESAEKRLLQKKALLCFGVFSIPARVCYRIKREIYVRRREGEKLAGKYKGGGGEKERSWVCVCVCALKWTLRAATAAAIILCGQKEKEEESKGNGIARLEVVVLATNIIRLKKRREG